MIRPAAEVRQAIAHDPSGGAQVWSTRSHTGGAHGVAVARPSACGGSRSWRRRPRRGRPAAARAAVPGRIVVVRHRMVQRQGIGPAGPGLARGIPRSRCSSHRGSTEAKLPGKTPGPLHSSQQGNACDSPRRAAGGAAAAKGCRQTPCRSVACTARTSNRVTHAVAVPLQTPPGRPAAWCIHRGRIAEEGPCGPSVFRAVGVVGAHWCAQQQVIISVRPAPYPAGAARQSMSSDRRSPAAGDAHRGLAGPEISRRRNGGRAAPLRVAWEADCRRLVVWSHRAQAGLTR